MPISPRGTVATTSATRPKLCNCAIRRSIRNKAAGSSAACKRLRIARYSTVPPVGDRRSLFGRTAYEFFEYPVSANDTPCGRIQRAHPPAP